MPPLTVSTGSMVERIPRLRPSMTRVAVPVTEEAARLWLIASYVEKVETLAPEMALDMSVMNPVVLVGILPSTRPRPET